MNKKLSLALLTGSLCVCALTVPAMAAATELNIMMSFPQYMDQWQGYCDKFEEKMNKFSPYYQVLD